MAKVDLSVSLAVPAEQVWALIGGFNDLAKWHPAVASSEEVDEDGRRLRRLKLHGGGEIVEALERHDDGSRSYGYTIVSGPLPVADYHSELTVRDDGERRATVQWQGRFEPQGEAAAAIAAIEGVYQAGLDSLKRRFGDRPASGQGGA
jgi:hypothetical protein